MTIPRSSSRTTLDSVQEAAWIRASQSGDLMAFNRLVLKWEHTIYNLTLRTLQNPEDAAETTQEIFFAAFRNISRFRKNSRFSTWLYRIAVNHCLTRLRRRPPVHYSLEAECEIPGFDTRSSRRHQQDEELLRSERRQKILDSLSLLPDDQRVVIELKFFQEETFDQISRILDVPLSTVKSRFYAALDHLKDRLSHFAEEAL